MKFSQVRERLHAASSEEQEEQKVGTAALVLVIELRVCSQRHDTAQGSLRRPHRREAATVRSGNEQRVK